MSGGRNLDPGGRLSRRSLLAWLGGLGLTALASACADDEPAGAPARTSTERGDASTGATPDCMLSPELTEGPFYLDLEKVRGDITEGRPGLPLALRVDVVDVDSCEPLAGAAVDVWHCDAGGTYSGVSGAGEGSAAGLTFLRGIQVTDAGGSARFRTIYPGWYPGRAVHIHVKVHVGSSETYTGQLFFDDELTDAVYQTAPYTERPDRDTRNDDDGIYAQSEGATVVAVTRDADRASGLVTLGMRRP